MQDEFEAGAGGSSFFLKSGSSVLFQQNALCFNVAKRKSKGLDYQLTKQKESRSQILPIRMVSGHFQDLYFVWQDTFKDLYHMSQMQRDSDGMLTVKTMYTSKPRILVIQELIKAQKCSRPTIEQFSIIILHSNYTLVMINPQMEEPEWTVVTQHLDPNPYLTTLYQRVKESHFCSIVLEKEMITA